MLQINKIGVIGAGNMGSGIAQKIATEGIAVAVALSMLDFVRRAWHPHHAILGRAPGVKGYHDLKRYPAARLVPELDAIVAKVKSGELGTDRAAPAEVANG